MIARYNAKKIRFDLEKAIQQAEFWIPGDLYLRCEHTGRVATPLSGYLLTPSNILAAYMISGGTVRTDCCEIRSFELEGYHTKRAVIWQVPHAKPTFQARRL